MDNYEYTQLLKTLNQKLENIELILKPDDIQTRLEEITTLEQEPEFWNNQEHATKISQEKNRLLGRQNKFKKASEAITDASDLYEM
ncbi:MAG: peptide chain release factor 2, partial [Campylobacterota bacterium]|nr:peptide chain release factor 2 [Campylobacterota bacterium]